MCKKIIRIMSYTLKNNKKNLSWYINISISPFFFSIISLLMFKGSKVENYTSEVLAGTLVMGIWMAILIGNRDESMRDKKDETLKLLIISPTPIRIIYLSRTIVHACFGVISVIEIFFAANILNVFKFKLMDFKIIILVLIMAIISFSVMGLLLTAILLIVKNTALISNIFSRLIYIISGVMFPITLLPSFLGMLSKLFSTTWIVKILRSTLTGRYTTGELVYDIFIIICLTVIYYLIATFLFKIVENKICRNADFRRM